MRSEPSDTKLLCSTVPNKMTDSAQSSIKTAEKLFYFKAGILSDFAAIPQKIGRCEIFSTIAQTQLNNGSISRETRRVGEPSFCSMPQRKFFAHVEATKDASDSRTTRHEGNFCLLLVEHDAVDGGKK